FSNEQNGATFGVPGNRGNNRSPGTRCDFPMDRQACAGRCAMTRWLYARVIDLHPDRFRQRFGEQMMSIFDDATRERGGFHLLSDGLVSVLRQRLLRAGPRQKLTHLVNLLWALATLPLHLGVAALVNPGTHTTTAELFYAVLTVLIFLSLY